MSELGGKGKANLVVKVSAPRNLGNKDKNWVKHKVSNEECEEAFFDTHKRILEIPKEVGHEKRQLLLASTRSGRQLFIVFLIRNGKVRVISARDLNKKERGYYEKEN